MEYISYLLITLGILLACLFLMRLPAQPEQLQKNGGRIKRQGKGAAVQGGKLSKEEIQHNKKVLQRELQHVPTPWGWPGHQDLGSFKNSHVPVNSQEVRGLSESIHHFVDRLFSKKRTVDNSEYLLRRDASLRAMVEDRYGRASAMKEIPYRKVKPPRLRDPSEPPDQMDSFPSGKVDQIAAKIPKQAETANILKGPVSLKKAVGQSKEVPIPWGW